MADDIQSRATEMMKKVLTVGVGTIFLTEESLRKLVSEFKLPKEMLTGILDSANKTKRDFLNSFSKEIVGRIIDRVDPRELVQEVLSRNSIHLNVEVEFKPKKKKSGK